MTKQEIANVIRDFSLDVQTALNDEFGDNKISTELRAFAERIEADEPEAPVVPVVEPKPLGTYDYHHGEER